MDETLKSAIARNAVSSLAARVALLMVAILLVPYLLARLGNEGYGTWVLISALVGYIGVLDLGFGSSFVKYVAEHVARGDRTGVNGVFSAGLIFYAVMAAVLVGATYPNVDRILRFFIIPKGMEGDARFVLELGIVAFVWANFVGVYQSVISGLHRMDISYGIAVLLSVCNGIGSVVAVELGFGLRGLAANQLVTQALGTALTAYCAHRLYPGLRPDLKAARRLLPALSRYGLNLQISRLTEMVDLQFDKLLLNKVMGATYVAFYDVGSRLPAALRSFPMFALATLTPASAILEVQSGRGEVYELYCRVSKYVSMAAFPLFGGLIVVAPAIVEAWAGQEYGHSILVTRILCVGYLANIIAGPVSPLVQGLGRPDQQRNADVVSLLLNVVMSVTLTLRYGFYGAPVGTSIAMSIAAVYYLWAFHRFMERPLLPFIRKTCLNVALCTLASGTVAVATMAVISVATTGRQGAALRTVVVGSVFVACYLVLILRCGGLDGRDAALLRRYVSFARRQSPR